MLEKLIEVLITIIVWFCCMMSFKLIEHFSRKWTNPKQANITIKQGKFWLSWLWKVPVNKDLTPEIFTKITYSWGVSKDLPDYKVELMKAYKCSDTDEEQNEDEAWNDLPIEFIPKKKTFMRAKKRLNKI